MVAAKGAMANLTELAIIPGVTLPPAMVSTDRATPPLLRVWAKVQVRPMHHAATGHQTAMGHRVAMVHREAMGYRAAMGRRAAMSNQAAVGEYISALHFPGSLLMFLQRFRWLAASSASWLQMRPM